LFTPLSAISRAIEHVAADGGAMGVIHPTRCKLWLIDINLGADARFAVVLTICSFESQYGAVKTEV
jgi:hypothetical protein